MKFKWAALWPVAIVCVLGLTVGANIILFMVARDPHAAAIEPDYYTKAVAWDSTLAEQQRSLRLGWSADAELVEASHDGANVRVRLLDREGHPLSGARVQVEAIHNLQADVRIKGVLAEADAGVYGMRMHLQREGLWELRLVVTRGHDRWETSLRREAQWASTAH